MPNKDKNPYTYKFSGEMNGFNTITVLQGELVVTSAERKRRYLASYGAGPCVLVAGYCPSTKKGFLGHLDAACDTKELNEAIYQLGSGESIEIHLAGGDMMTKDQVERIQKFLKDKKNLVIKSSNVITGNTGQLALDTATGEVTDYFDPVALNTHDINLRIQVMAAARSSASLRMTSECGGG